MTRFTDQEWIDAVEKAVADKGAEFVYQPLPRPDSPGRTTCLYAEEIQDGAGVHLVPSCLVGHAAYLLGGMELLQKLHDLEGGDAYAVLEDAELASERARNWLSDVQGSQDMGFTWGQALAMNKMSEQ